MIAISLKEYLIGWATDYEKHRDIIKKEIERMDKGGEADLVIIFKDKKKHIFIMPALEPSEELRAKVKNKELVTIITINSKDNVKALIENWKLFSDLPGLTMIFINPFSEQDKRWMIKPYIHSMVSENGALKQGLKSMAATVDYITEKEFLSKI